MLARHRLVYAGVSLVTCLSAILARPVFTKNKHQIATTRNLNEIFIGRCWEYQEVVRPDLFAEKRKDCNALWSNFTSAFAYKEPCNTTDDDYRSFAEAATHSVNEDESLFWESVYPFVNDFSSNGKRYTTIADTLFGYMVSDLQWCGQLEDPGINYQYCPTWEECESVNGQMADYSYWQKTSEYFSAETSGHSSVLLNGTHHIPFDPESIFATRELVNLTPENNVTHLHIMVLHDLGGVIRESCGEGSLLQLENQAIQQGLVVSCENDPPSIRYFQCVDMPTSAECVNVTRRLPTVSRT